MSWDEGEVLFKWSITSVRNLKSPLAHNRNIEASLSRSRGFQQDNQTLEVSRLTSRSNNGPDFDFDHQL